MRALFVYASVVTVVAAPLTAQEAPRRVGLGITFASFGSNDVRVPLALSPRHRLEPEIGFSHSFGTLVLGGTTRETKSTSINVGAGLFFLSDVGEKTNVHFGPRLGIVFSHMRTTDATLGDDEAESTSWYAEVAGGGEHFLSSRFSLGAEVQLGYYHGGEPTTSGTTTFASWSSRIGTGVAALLRWYL